MYKEDYENESQLGGQKYVHNRKFVALKNEIIECGKITSTAEEGLATQLSYIHIVLKKLDSIL